MLLDGVVRRLADQVRALARLAREKEAARPPEPGPGGPAVATSRTSGAIQGAVLVVDDDEAIRRVTVRMLEREGFRVVTTAGGAEGVARVARGEVAAILVDHRMPDLSGLQVAACAAALRPDLAGRVVIMTGDPDDEALAAAEAQGRIRVLAKPFDARQAVEALRGG